MSENKLYFKNLDAIRFIAAMMVFLQHSIVWVFPYFGVQKDSLAESFLDLFTTGVWGVSIFFCLSGFLITYLLVSEYEMKGKIALGNFYLRRIFRIWPLYFAIIAIGFVVYPFLRSLGSTHEPLCSNVWYYVTFLSNFDVLHILQYCNGNDVLSQNITWSIAIEEQFYLFWPLLFFVLPKRAWAYAISALVIASIIFRLMHNNEEYTLYFHTLAVLFDLAFGGLMALAIKEWRQVRKFFEGFDNRRYAIWLSFAVLVLFFSKLLFRIPYGAALGRVFTAIIFTITIAAQAMTQKESIFNLKNFRFADRWGKYTYGIYLIHPVVILSIDSMIKKSGLADKTIPAILFFALLKFAVTLALSKLSYDAFESKFLKLKDKFAAIITHK